MMDNIREKLVELLKDPPCNTADEEDCADCKYRPEYFCSEEMMADILIANGVTVQKEGIWIGEGDGYADGEIVYDVWYCGNCNHCIDDGTDDYDLLPNFCPDCGMKKLPLPTPPKGE